MTTGEKSITAEFAENRKDLSVLARARLIQGAFEAISKKDTTEAQMFFGAAIRKAKRVQLWDIEAEYYKFVTLYLDGNYSEAVRRCIECLDGTKEFTDAAMSEGIVLPREAVINRLEECLHRAMVMRKDSFVDLVRHFWEPSYGEYYLLKNRLPLIEAIFQAWKVYSRTDVSINYEKMKNELSVFSAYLQSKYDQAKDVGGEVLEKQAAARSERNAPSSDIMETSNTNFLTMALSKGITSLDSDETDKVLAIVKSSSSPYDLTLIAKLIDILGPRSRRPYYTAFKSSPLLGDVSRIKDPLAINFVQEAVEFHKSMENDG